MARKAEEQKQKEISNNDGKIDEDQFPSLDTAVAEFEQAQVEEEKRDKVESKMAQKEEDKGKSDF